MSLARAERAEFAVMLHAFTPQQWEAATLCAEWPVRDVVAHVISYEELDGRGLLRRYARGRFVPRRVNAVGVADYADRTPEQIVAMIRANFEPHGLTGGFGGRIALTDGMIHQQDIRRSLGMPRTIDPERLHTALDFARFAPTIRGAWRARGIRLRATDIDWAYGNGPEVRGSGEALLMAMAGRRAALDDLDGPGKAKLAQRF